MNVLLPVRCACHTSTDGNAQPENHRNMSATERHLVALPSDGILYYHHGGFQADCGRVQRTHFWSVLVPTADSQLMLKMQK